MSKTLKTLFVVAGLTVSTLASAATALDSKSYGSSVGSCQMVAHHASLSPNIIRPEPANRLFDQMNTRFRQLKGQDQVDAVHAYNRASDLLPRAKVSEVSEDFNKCFIWAFNIK